MLAAYGDFAMQTPGSCAEQHRASARGGPQLALHPQAATLIENPTVLRSYGSPASAPSGEAARGVGARPNEYCIQS